MRRMNLKDFFDGSVKIGPLAKRIGVDHRTLGQARMGKAALDATAITRLAIALGSSFDDVWARLRKAHADYSTKPNGKKVRK